MSTNIDAYFDEQIGSAFDDIANIYNVRRAQAKAYFTASDKLHSFDTRIQNALRYLLAKQDTTRQITYECLDEAVGLGFADDTDVFASAVLAFISQDMEWIERIVNGYLGLNEDEVAEAGPLGLVDALTWLPDSISSPWLARFLASKDLNHKWLATSAYALLGTFPQQELEAFMMRDDCQQHLALFERLIFVAGQTRETSVHPILRDTTSHEHGPIQTSTHWARWMMNDRNFFSSIIDFSLKHNDAFHTLSPWIVLSYPVSESKKYLSSVLKCPDLADDLIIHAVALHGDPSVLPWLIEKYPSPALAPWLAMACHHITGLDIHHPELTMDSAPDIESASEQGLYLDQDMSIPYPNTQTLLALTRRLTQSLRPNQRHFLGQVVEHAQDVADRYGHHALGFVRQYAGLYSALTGQRYQPYTHIKVAHHAAPADNWLR